MTSAPGIIMGFAVSPAAPKAPRVIEKGRRYSAGKARLWLEQDKHCARCPRYLRTPAEGHRHHIHGRGMGGGKRDDRDTELICHGCHAKAKIERRESWVALQQECATKLVQPAPPAAQAPSNLIVFPARQTLTGGAA